MSVRVASYQIVAICLGLLSAGHVDAQAKPEPLDFQRLAEPSILDQLQLTDEQRIKLAKLEQEQAQALASESVDDRAKNLSLIDSQIRQLLTPEQLKLFRALPGNAKLTFNFRQTEWLDVLDWFARQAGLSLVVNEPPPGTFTYSDSKSYTPVQALDLLNGVLITRGFTLVRRERMLICLNLSEGVPSGMLPRVLIEDLDQYGNFELVQVMFPLGGRPAPGVAEEITPLIGSFGEAVALPQTKQLLVWTTAGKMRAVSAVIASIPEPSKPKQKPPQPPAPKPELRIYPVSKIDPNAAVETLKVLLPDAKLTIDQRANQINAFAVPSQQAAIQKMLDQMSSDASDAGQLSLETYPVDRVDPSELVEQLRMVVPEATITSDSEPSRVIAYASADDHRKLASSLQKLEVATGETTRRVDVYALKRSEPSTVAEALRSLYPRISVVVDGQRLIVVAGEAEQAVVHKLVQQLDVASDQMRTVKSYPRPRNSVPAILGLLKSLAPNAEIQEDGADDRWLVVATSADHAQIADVLQQLVVGEVDRPRKQLRLYGVTTKQREQFLSTYQTLDPDLSDIQVVAGGALGELRIVADEKRHQRVADLLNEIKIQFPRVERQLRFYPADAQLRQQFTSLRSKLAPELAELETVDDVLGRGIGVIGSDAEHERLTALLQQLRETIPAKKSVLRIFPVTPTLKKRFQGLLPSLEDQLSGVRIIDDAQPSQVAVWATEVQHKQVQTLLESLRTSNVGSEMELITYPLMTGDPESVQSILVELYPDTKIVADEESRRVMVWTTADQHSQIRRAIEQLDKPSTAGTSKMAYYKIGEVDARDVVRMFEDLLPKMTLTVDRDSNSIIAWGTERDHQLMAKTVEEFRKQSEGERKTVVSYPCGARDLRDVRRLVDDLVPRARLVTDAGNRTLIVWATPQEHATVQAAITEMTQGRDEQGGSLRVYRVENIDADDLTPMLQATVPSAQVTSSADDRQLLVWANEEDQRKIAAVVEQIESGNPLQANGSLHVYESRPSVLQQVSKLIPTFGSEFKIVSDDDSSRLVVWTTITGHQRLEQLIDDLEEQVTDQPLSTAAYDLGSVSVTEARELISSVASKVRYFQTGDDQRLLVRASAADHQEIQTVLEDLKAAKGQAGDLQLHVYSVGENDPTTILELLDPKLTQGISMIPDVDRKALVARTSTDRHQTLSAALDELLKKLPEAAKKSSRVYRLKHANPSTLQTSLAEMMPEISFAVDAETRSLMATALPNEHQLIEQAVKQLDQASDSDRETKVYRVAVGNAAATRDVLQALLPDAVMAVDASDQALVVTATPQQHVRIQQTVTAMDRDEETRQTRVYRFKYGDVDSARDVLTALLPQAVMATDDANRSLLVTAADAEHQRIDQIVQQLDLASEDERIARVYRFRFADVAAAQTALQPLLPDAIIAVDASSRALVATASPSDHARIQAIVKELDVQRDDPTEARVYPFLVADVAAAQQVLKSLLPNAAIAADLPNRILVATATVEEHEKIAATVEQMDAKNDRQPSLQSYSIRQANAESVFESIRRMYEDNPLVLISFDSRNRTLFVKAPIQEHLTIARLVSQMDNAVDAVGEQRLAVYPVGLADDSLLSTLRSLVDRPSEEAEFSLDELSRQLVVVANERQHRLIKSALDQLKRDEVIVEVFPLQTVDPFAVESAIDRLFEDEVDRPIANGDTDTQQLFVRGTKTQIDEIRQLLTKMGELPTQLAAQDGLRVVPFRGDIEQAIRQIEKVWPKLRPNKFQVIQPPRAPQIEAIDSTSPDVDPADADPPAIDRIDLDQTQRPTRFETRVVATEDEGPADKDQAAEQQAAPAILVVPGRGTVTLMSADEEALNQAAALFGTLARRGNIDTGAGNFAVVTLRNAGARKVAKTLDDLFKKMPITTRTTLGKVSMVADDRLNALVIHGRPADRAAVADLLRVLDSSSVPDTLANARPTIIRLEHADAERVVKMLEGVYESQLESGGSRPEISIPEGISSEVASVLQQINAAAAGPLLTLQVDRVTNSIVVLAPRQLSGEVKTLIGQLDQEARENDTREIGVISLESVNAEQIQEALEQLIAE